MVHGDEFIHRMYYHTLISGLVVFTLMLEDFRNLFHTKAYSLSDNHSISHFIDVVYNGFYSITYFQYSK